MNPKKPAFPGLSGLMAMLTRLGGKNLPRGSAEAGNQPPGGALIAANSTQPSATMIGVCNEIPRFAGEGHRWWPIAPKGNFPISLETKDGKGVERVIQVIDDEALQEMVQAFNSSVRGMLSVGLPIYDGHADDAKSVKEQPNLRPYAVGRLKELEIREGGLWGRVAINSAGSALIDGDAPAVACQSPRWFMREIPGVKTGEAKHYRPVLIASLALTNTPNLPRHLVTVAGLNEADPEETQPEPTSDPMPTWLIEMLKTILGTAEVTEDAAKAALTKLIADANAKTQAEAEKAKAEADKATADQAATAATTAAANSASRAAQLEAELVDLRRSRADLVVSNAVAAGRITEAQRSQIHSGLVAASNQAAFDAEVQRLNGLTPAVNTAPFRAPPAGQQIGRGVVDKIAEINRRVDEHAAAKGLPRDQAWHVLKKQQPALFA